MSPTPAKAANIRYLHLLNQIIRPGEDTVLMIDGDFTQMLHGEGISLTSGFWFELAIT